MTQTINNCAQCKHWSNFDELVGECKKLPDDNYVIIETGCMDCGVDNLLTNASFGCTLWEAQDDTD